MQSYREAPGGRHAIGRAHRSQNQRVEVRVLQDSLWGFTLPMSGPPGSVGLEVPVPEEECSPGGPPSELTAMATTM